MIRYPKYLKHILKWSIFRFIHWQPPHVSHKPQRRHQLVRAAGCSSRGPPRYRATGWNFRCVLRERPLPLWSQQRPRMWPSQQEAREFSQFCMYPLVNVYITIENHHFQWVNHGKSTISMAIFNSYVTNYQRVHECWLHSHSKYTKIYWYYKMNHPASSSRPSPPQAQPWSCPWHSSMTGSKPLSK